MELEWTPLDPSGTSIFLNSGELPLWFLCNMTDSGQVGRLLTSGNPQPTRHLPEKYAKQNETRTMLAETTAVPEIQTNVFFFERVRHVNLFMTRMCLHIRECQDFYSRQKVKTSSKTNAECQGVMYFYCPLVTCLCLASSGADSKTSDPSTKN